MAHIEDYADDSEHSTYSALQALALLLVTALVFTVSCLTLDIPIATYCKYDLHPSIKQIAEQTSDSGDIFLIVLVLTALIAKFRLKNDRLFRIFLFSAIASLLAGIVANILKPMIGRLRPKAYFEMDGAYGLEPFSGVNYLHASFPSGHTTCIMAMMTVLAIYFPKWRIPCFMIAGIIGLTRVLLKAHYVSDVLAGFALGYLFALYLQRFLANRGILPAVECDSY